MSQLTTGPDTDHGAAAAPVKRACPGRSGRGRIARTPAEEDLLAVHADLAILNDRIPRK
ncbi:MAG: hypothetical protein JWM42_717 [Burkholderia sp.]|nr:hypothetical protein [Burkholderia sp.]